MSPVESLAPEQRFLRAYDNLSRALWRYAYFRVSSNQLAEDLVSETFTRAWDRYRENPVGELRPLLYRILHNLIIDHYRQHRATVSLEEIGDQPSAQHTKILLNIELREAEELLAKLPDDYRQIIIWRYVNDLDIGEIAELAGKSRSGVYVTIHRALKKLRQLNENNKHYAVKTV